MTLRSRFGKEMDDLAKGYTASIPFDRRLYEYDIAGSIAHARMLAKQGIISDRDAELIIMGLTSIREEIEQDRFEFKKELEDIHMNIEVRLIAKVGDPGAKLHTARSRNDQVALDMRLFTKDAIAETLRRLKALQKALLDQAQSSPISKCSSGTLSASRTASSAPMSCRWAAVPSPAYPMTSTATSWRRSSASAK